MNDQGEKVETPKSAGAASPFGSGTLKHPRFPPVAMGASVSGSVDLLQPPYCTTSSTQCHSAGTRQFVSRKMKMISRSIFK